MRMHHHLPGEAADFGSADIRLERLTDDWVPWLDAADRYQIRLGLHELLMNIRNHAYADGPGSVDLLFSASTDAFRVDVTDWGRPFLGPLDRVMPSEPQEGGYGLAIVASVFDCVRYRRLSDRNWWTLEVSHAEDDVT